MLEDFVGEYDPNEVYLDGLVVSYRGQKYISLDCTEWRTPAKSKGNGLNMLACWRPMPTATMKQSLLAMTAVISWSFTLLTGRKHQAHNPHSRDV